jgi:hypothetical protein
VPSTTSETCSRPSDWGPCQQPAGPEGPCSAHTQWETRGTRPDRYYEEKVVKGYIEPTWDWMSEHEAHALINGRYRGDGRRIDQWVLPEGPMGVELEAPRTIPWTPHSQARLDRAEEKRARRRAARLERGRL